MVGFKEAIENFFSNSKAERGSGSDELNNYYNLVKQSLFFDDVGLTDDKKFLEDLVDEWCIQAPNLKLKEGQRKLNIELLNSIIRDFNKIIKDFDLQNYESDSNLHAFLQSNKDNKDLKAILNLKRGELGTTLLHVFLNSSKVTRALLQAGADPNAQDDKGKTALHDAAHYGYESKEVIDYLLEAGANSNIRNNDGKTPQQVALDSNNYGFIEHSMTDNQKKLKEVLYAMLENTSHLSDEDWDTVMLNEQGVKNLKEFLDRNKDNEDLKIVLNIRDKEAKSKVLEKAVFTEVKDLLIEAGATTSQVEKEKADKPLACLQSQLIKLDEFLDKVLKAKDIAELQKVTSYAIDSGVRLNLAKGDSYFADYVIKRISELEKKPNVASDIICKLILKGARLKCEDSEKVLNELESECKNHKAKVIKSHEIYINRAQKFLEVAKSATSSKLLDARMDNTTFELQYSGDSKIDVARIIDGAKNAGLTQGSIEYGRNIIKIGESEVEVETQNGKRNYVNLSNDSDVVLTFTTSLGNLQVRLYPNANHVKVEVSDQETLKKLEELKEEIGINCTLGGLSVNEAIEQGFFVRSGNLLLFSEVMSQSIPDSELDNIIIQAKGKSKICGS